MISKIIPQEDSHFNGSLVNLASEYTAEKFANVVRSVKKKQKKL